MQHTQQTRTTIKHFLVVDVLPEKTHIIQHHNNYGVYNIILKYVTTTLLLLLIKLVLQRIVIVKWSTFQAAPP